MKILKFLLPLLIVVVLPFTHFFYKFLSNGEHVIFSSEVSEQYLQNLKNKNGRKILLVHVVKGFGGAEMHTMNLYTSLINRGYNVRLLVANDSGLSTRCKDAMLPYFTTNAEDYRFIKAIYRRIIRSRLYELSKDCEDSIIQVHTEHEAWASKQLGLPVKVVVTKHVPDSFKYVEDTMKGLSGIVAVSRYIEKDLQAKNDEGNFGVKSIDYIAPFFNEDKFLTFKTNETKKTFFKQHFNIELKDVPVMCMIANMYKDALHKNHRLLFGAMSKLIHENKPVQLVLAGDGTDRKNLEKVTRELGIREYVHFLGFTDKTADVLYHSDINILPSGKEAFGIVLLEGALMKKPQIYSTGNGGDVVVLHEKTGLLFKNNNADDLLVQIERILDNPKWAKTLGENAHLHVKENLSSAAGLKKLENFYDKLEK